MIYDIFNINFKALISYLHSKNNLYFQGLIHHLNLTKKFSLQELFIYSFINYLPKKFQT